MAQYHCAEFIMKKFTEQLATPLIRQMSPVSHNPAFQRDVYKRQEQSQRPVFRLLQKFWKNSPEIIRLLQIFWNTGNFPNSNLPMPVSYTHLEYKCCAIEDVEFPEESFDVILSSLAFHYVADYEILVKKI